MKVSDLICYVLDYLDANIYEEINNDDLSSYFGYDKSYLIKKFKTETSFTIREYVNSSKVINSVNDLKSDDTLLKIALNNGFNSLEYYSEMFTRTLGANPSTFRKILIKLKSLDEYASVASSTKEEYDKILFSLLSKEEIKIYLVFEALTQRLNILQEVRNNNKSQIMRLNLKNQKKMVA